MSSDKPLLEMRRAQFPDFEGVALETELFTPRLTDEPVRRHLEEMSKGMKLPKSVVAGHALTFLINQVDTKKAHDFLRERSATIGKHGNPSRTEGVAAPAVIVAWIREAALRLNEDERTLIETAIELYYASWAGKRKPKRARKAA